MASVLTDRCFYWILSGFYRTISRFARITDKSKYVNLNGMKKIVVLLLFVLTGVGAFSQTYRSRSATIRRDGFEIDRTVRSIAISDKEITISNYLNGNTEPLVLHVYLVEEKEDRFDGLCRYYYCTAANDEKLSPYQKIIVIKKPYSITLELFLADNNKYVHDLEING